MRNLTYYYAYTRLITHIFGIFPTSKSWFLVSFIFLFFTHSHIYYLLEIIFIVLTIIYVFLLRLLGQCVSQIIGTFYQVFSKIIPSLRWYNSNIQIQGHIICKGLQGHIIYWFYLNTIFNGNKTAFTQYFSEYITWSLDCILFTISTDFCYLKSSNTVQDFLLSNHIKYCERQRKVTLWSMHDETFSHQWYVP